MTTSGEMEVSNENTDGLSVFFLAEGEQTAESVLARLTSFISEAKQSLDFAVYDMRLDDPLKNELPGRWQIGRKPASRSEFVTMATSRCSRIWQPARIPRRREPVHLCSR